MKTEIFDDQTLKALKQCITGLTTKEVITEYAVDDETGKLKVLKQKVNEKNVPPNTDIIKLIYQHYTESQLDYNKLSDEELEQEKQRLLLQLKGENNDSRKIKNKS